MGFDSLHCAMVDWPERQVSFEISKGLLNGVL